MDGSSLIVAVMPIVTLIALFTGIALPFIAGSRPGRSHPASGWQASGAQRARAPAGYLYVPCARIRCRGYPAQARRRVQQVPIVKTTAQRIYYASDSWDRREAVISPGCISREQFETDTRCGDDSEHCPHRDDRCRHGYPAGVIPVPGDRPGPAGRLFFATRAAAEDHLHRGERGASRAGRTASTTHPAAAPRHGRRPPRPWRHGRAVHPGAPPVPDGAPGRARVTCPPRRPPADTTALHQEQLTVPAAERPPVTGRDHAAVGRWTTSTVPLATTRSSQEMTASIVFFIALGWAGDRGALSRASSSLAPISCSCLRPSPARTFGNQSSSSSSM